MGQTSIATRAETLERFNRLKAELNDLNPDDPDHNADSFLNALMDTWEIVGEIPEEGPEAITDALADDEVAIVAADGTAQDLADSLSGVDADLRAKLDRIESAAEAAEDRTGSIQNTLENAGLGR